MFVYLGWVCGGCGGCVLLLCCFDVVCDVPLFVLGVVLVIVVFDFRFVERFFMR